MKTADQIAVMQASLEGKPIHFRRKGNTDWCMGQNGHFAWNWDDFEYEVAPEPAEPRRWKVSIRRDNGKLYAYDEMDDEMHEKYEVVDVIHALPGWKLVKEDEPKGRPLPEGVPQPPDGFDYWGIGPLPHRGGEASAAIAQWHPTSPWWNHYGVGFDPESHYALARGTALHAANFGEVGS